MSSREFVARVPKKTPQPADIMYPEVYAKVRHLLRDDFFVLNIGANDGLDNDPIHPFLLMYPEWRGVFVEPIPYNFVQLVNNYKEFPGIILEQAAITNAAASFYYVDEDEGCDMRWASQICSTDRTYVEKSLEHMRLGATTGYCPPGTITEDAEAHIVEDSSIVCMTMDELIQKHDITRVDFLNIDAEGQDFEIFSSFDIERFSPAILCIENATFNDDERAKFREIIQRNGYRHAARFALFSGIYIKA